MKTMCDETETLANGAKQSKLAERCDLLPPEATLAVAAVFGYGAGKYGDTNWHGIPVRSHLNHALRHVFQFLAGDDTEDHLEHAACRMLMALQKRYMDRDGCRRQSESGSGPT